MIYNIFNIKSSIIINSNVDIIWENITNVDINNFKHPIYFKLLDIPQPLSADILVKGVGGKRIANFSNGKKFIQEIIIWEQNIEYAFTFNPENDFRICFFFDLTNGVFQIPEGAYLISPLSVNKYKLKLYSTYKIDKRVSFLLKIPITFILKLFQKYLLNSIKRNCERQTEKSK